MPHRRGPPRPPPAWTRGAPSRESPERRESEKEPLRPAQVVARFGAVGEHWYAGTVQDATRAAEGVFTVAFDDGDVDDAVRREDIRVPRLAGGDRVEALYGATDHYYPATVVGVNSRDGVYRLKFDDGDVLPRAPRTSRRAVFTSPGAADASNSALDEARRRLCGSVRHAQ